MLTYNSKGLLELLTGFCMNIKVDSDLLEDYSNKMRDDNGLAQDDGTKL